MCSRHSSVSIICSWRSVCSLMWAGDLLLSSSHTAAFRASDAHWRTLIPEDTQHLHHQHLDVCATLIVFFFFCVLFNVFQSQRSCVNKVLRTSVINGFHIHVHTVHHCVFENLKENTHTHLLNMCPYNKCHHFSHDVFEKFFFSLNRQRSQTSIENCGNFLTLVLTVEIHVSWQAYIYVYAREPFGCMHNVLLSLTQFLQQVHECSENVRNSKKTWGQSSCRQADCSEGVCELKLMTVSAETLLSGFR